MFRKRCYVCYALCHLDVAVSHNNNEVCVYRVNGSRFDLVTSLSEHAQRVTGIDWGAKTNMIVTCSAVRTR